MKPLRDIVVLNPVVIEDKKTTGGIYIPHTASDNQPLEAIVVDVGPEVSELKPGDTVLYNKHLAQQLDDVYETSVVIMRCKDIMLKIEEE